MYQWLKISNPEKSQESSEDNPNVRDRDRSSIRYLEEEQLISRLVDRAVDERTACISTNRRADRHKLAEGRYKG